MKGLVLNRIPGYREALQKANAKTMRSRENAWKGVSHDIIGFKIKTLSVRDYVMLDHFGSPFLNRMAPEIGDISFTLWALSHRCEQWNNGIFLPNFVRTLEAWRYSRKVVNRIKTTEDFTTAIKLIFQYIEEMFLDAPPSVKNGRVSGLCYLTSWFDLIQSEHGLSESEIWLMPLPQLFQRIRAIHIRKGERLPAFNHAEDELKAWIQSGISSRKFTMEDLAEGRIKFGDN